MTTDSTKPCRVTAIRTSCVRKPLRFSPGTLCILSLLAAGAGAQAQTIAPEGCPTFHCTVEATGVIAQRLISSVNTTISDDSLGELQKQGCSSDGTRLACLFLTDDATGSSRGTLKLLDATTLQPLWGSAEGSSYNLDAASASDGQVPVMFADSTIGAGDFQFYVHYDQNGAVITKVPLLGKAVNFGLTVISPTYGIVSQQNAVLTLVKLTNWTSGGTLQLLDPQTNGKLQLVSPASGTAGVLYAVALNKANHNGYLFAVIVNPATNKLAIGWVFPFLGQSGTSAVVVTPTGSGLADNLILLHVPGLPGDSVPHNRLVGLLDLATGWQQAYAIPLTAPLVVAPTFDPGSKSLFYHQNYSPIIYQNQLATGAAIRSFNLQKIAGFPNLFQLNTHLGVSQAADSAFTLLLGADYTSPPGVGAQYVMAFQPVASPNKLLWSEQIGSAPASYMAAWNSAPSSQTGIACLIAIPVAASGSASIVRLCDF
jgi:hypothetical protein